MTEIIRVNNFLRITLWADALTCIGCGLLLTFGGGFLQNLFGLPGTLMFYAGASLFPFVALVIFAATRTSISKNVIWLIIAINILWVVDSFLLLLSGYVAPTSLGYAFVVLQALGVAAFADLEFIGMRKAEVVVVQNAAETI